MEVQDCHQNITMTKQCDVVDDAVEILSRPDKQVYRILFPAAVSSANIETLITVARSIKPSDCGVHEANPFVIESNEPGGQKPETVKSFLDDCFDFAAFERDQMKKEGGLEVYLGEKEKDLTVEMILRVGAVLDRTQKPEPKPLNNSFDVLAPKQNPQPLPQVCLLPWIDKDYETIDPRHIMLHHVSAPVTRSVKPLMLSKAQAYVCNRGISMNTAIQLARGEATYDTKWQKLSSLRRVQQQAQRINRARSIGKRHSRSVLGVIRTFPTTVPKLTSQLLSGKYAFRESSYNIVYASSFGVDLCIYSTIGMGMAATLKRFLWIG